MKHPFSLLWCLAGLLLSVGCSRRVLVPVEPLALRPPPITLAPLSPGQLHHRQPNLPVYPAKTSRQLPQLS